MERKIGEIFEYNGEWYQCLENNNCRCDYCELDGVVDCCKIACASGERIDNKEVYFKKLRKIGEPYRYMDGIYQQYRVYSNPYFLDVWHTPTTNGFAVKIKQTKEDMEEYKMYDAKEDIPEFDNVVDECLFSEEKPNLKPFDLEAAKAGKPVCTRDGRKARIICFDFRDADEICCIIAAVDYGEAEKIHYYDLYGKYRGGDSSEHDLMMLPEKKEGWINIYNADTTFYYVEGMVYNTKDEAIQKAKKEITTEQREKSEYVDTVKINWEE